MNLVKSIGTATAVVLVCAAGVAAQSQSSTTEKKEKTKIEIKGGEDVKLAGCLQRVAGGSGFALTDTDGALKYALVTDEDLTKYVNRRVEVKGHASDRGDAKVKIERKVEGTTGEKKEKVETKGDMVELPYLGLTSIKRLKGRCQ